MVLLRVIASFVLLLTPGADDEVIGQLPGVPAYFTVGTWDRLAGPGLAVANPVSGPGRRVDPELAAAIEGAHDRGVTVLGYVTTGYLGRTGRVTRFGETGEASWLAQTQQEIAAWYRLYGAHGLAGIFLDEVPDACAVTPGYRELRAFTRRYDPAARVAVNPGTGVPDCFSGVADVLVAFEGDLAAYRAWQPPAWQLAQDPRRFWHLVHGAADPAEAMRLGRLRNAGYMYVTPDTLANPWDTLPPAAYWAAEREAGAAPVKVPPARPGAPEVAVRGATSLRLRWTGVTGAVAYEVYRDGQWTGGTLGAAPEFDLDGLKPGRSYEFRVRARDRAGNLSAPGPAVRLGTLPFPGVRPAPPGDLTATRIRPSGLRLSWQASSGVYDVYQDGRLIATTTGTALAVGSLEPATTTTFTVVARNDAGGASGPDLTVTTPPAASAPITEAAGEIGADAVVYQARFGRAFDLHQVLLDLDGDRDTGVAVAGLGADHLIESGWLFRQREPGWNWTPVAPVSLAVSDDLYVWRVPKTAFPEISRHRVVFKGAVPEAYSEVVEMG
ncbi:spherulation-specific family 4 protein [Acrocarpospora catenulata]|uniref:spherulation-specific family 4 protein n=1 Tax=Acrocarpospora catenulata TaxID=2836182 RepID=UPI001BD9F82B|nr:spherulation-specific family 4 protein [Acrocarpospora catenulata]